MPSFADIFDTAEETSFGPTDTLAPGKYVAKIVHTNVGTTRSGKPSYGFMFKDVESGDIAWMNQYFHEGNPKATNVFVAIMKRLGITGPMLDADADAALETTKGKVFKITVTHDKDWVNVSLGNEVTDNATAKAEVPSPPSAAVPEADVAEPAASGDPKRPW